MVPFDRAEGEEDDREREGEWSAQADADWTGGGDIFKPRISALPIKIHQFKFSTHAAWLCPPRMEIECFQSSTVEQKRGTCIILRLVDPILRRELFRAI